jgi:multiple sugar transport system substrate-binding protein
MYRTLIANTLLLDITDNLKADPLVGAKGYFIEPQEEQRCTQDGKWYGIGSCWVAPHIYYNADVFAEAGVEPPSNDPAKAWTWQQFLDAATALTIDATGKHPNESGFDAENIQRWGVQWANNWYFLDSAIVGNGGYYVDPNTGLFVLDQPAATEAVQNLADLVLKHKVSPAGTAMEALGMTNTQMLDTGRLAMAIDGSWALSWLYKITAKLGTGVLPGMSEKTGTDMQAHFHSGFTSTQHPAESWEWLRFLATPFYQTQFCKIGLWLPSQTDLMTQEGLTTWLTPGVHPDGYVDIATKFVPQYGKTMFMPPGWQEANTQVIVPAIEKIWIGDATAEEALIAVMPEANKILQEAAKS